MVIILILCCWSYTICCYWGRSNLTKWWANTFSSEGHIIIAIQPSYVEGSHRHHYNPNITSHRHHYYAHHLVQIVIIGIVIPSVCWTKVTFLLLLIFRFNRESSQLGKWLSWIDSPLNIQFWSICWRRWNSFHLESRTKYQKHTFFVIIFLPVFTRFDGLNLFTQ